MEKIKKMVLGSFLVFNINSYANGFSKGIENITNEITSNVIDVLDNNITSKNSIIKSNLLKLDKFIPRNVEQNSKFMFTSYKYINSFISFIEKNKGIKLKIGDDYIVINKFNIYLGLIHLAKIKNIDIQKEEDWFDIITMYEKHISDYLESSKDGINKVFFIGARDSGPSEAYSSLNNIKYIYENTCNSMEDFSEGQGIDKNSIIVNIEKYLKENPKSKTLVHLGLHGTENGLTIYDGYYFSKEEFNKLRKLSLKYNMTLIIDSCYAGKKFLDNLKGGNLIITSNQEKSISIGYAESFIRAYHYMDLKKTKRNGNFLITKEIDTIPSFAEATLYTFINSEIGYINISYIKDGKIINLSF